MSNSTKCLMIGQHGIGKSTFLTQFPNSKPHLPTLPSSPTNQLQHHQYASRENYTIPYPHVNNNADPFEMSIIEVENCDVTLETCLHTKDLIVNNKIIPSSQIINTCPYKVIVLCFAMDDPSSFDLIKSKWEIDLKKNKKMRHSFVLLGLKADMVRSTKDKKKSPKSNRSLSIGSKSNFDTDQNLDINKFSSKTTTSSRPISYYKKFAKLIGAQSFIKVSNTDENSFEKIVAYDRFIQNICKVAKENKSSSLECSSSQSFNEDHEVCDFQDLSQDKKSNFKRLPKSLSAPLRIFQRKSQTPNVISNNEKIAPVNHDENYQNLEQQQTESSFSIKSKLSQFVMNVGTYVVTCGGSNSRKLAHLKRSKSMRTAGGGSFGSRLSSNIVNRSFRRKKSLLLSSSEISLNTIDNEILLN